MFGLNDARRASNYFRNGNTQNDLDGRMTIYDGLNPE